MDINTIKRKFHTFKSDRRIFFKKLVGSPLYKYLPDKYALKLVFKNVFGYSLNLKNPQTFNEKLQWFKLYNRNPFYTRLVDKIEVKNIVSEAIGGEYVIPTLGIYDRFDDIDLGVLPERFVIKTNHGGGNTGVVICTDKSIFDFDGAKKKIEKSLATDTYIIGREWPYKNVKRRILIEQLLVPSNGELDLVDYKFFCFNGVVHFFKIDFNRKTNHQANYYDLDWNLLDVGECVCPPDKNHIESKPLNFERMVEIASAISKDIPFVRVDLYNIDGQIFFGEATFFPASGFGLFVSQVQDIKLGSFLSITK